MRRAATHRWVRRVEAYSFAIAFERLAIQEGLRAASAVATMVAAAVWLDWPRLSWAAFGAFWACLADPGGKDRSRLGFISLFACAGTVAAFTASAAAGVSPLLGALALVPLVFVPSLSPMYGIEASRVGTLVCVVAVVAIAFPNPPGDALKLAGLFLLGCLWAVILCIGIWRIHRDAPARRAIALIFAQLGSMGSELLALDQAGGSGGADWDAFNAEHRRSIRDMIERARSIVATLETSDVRYRCELETADHTFAALIAIGHAAARRDTPLAATERDLVGRLLLLLAEAEHQVEHRTPQAARLSSEARALERESTAVDPVIGHGIGAAAQALGNLAGVWRGMSPLVTAPALVPQGAVRLLKPIPATSWTHAARVTIAVVAAYAVGSRLNLTFSYWATMAAVVVVQPEAGAIWQRSIERMLGSIAGGVLAAFLMFVLPMKAALLVLIFPIAAATIAFRLVNYTIFVLFVTALFVLVTELLQPVAGVASVRVLDNVIGSLIGLAASLLLWRGQRGKRPGEMLADAVKANFAYAAAVTAAAQSPEEIDKLRRAAGLASNAAEAMRHRMALEGQRGRAHLAEMADLLSALRRLAGAVIVASMTAARANPARAAALNEDGARLTAALERPLMVPAPTVPAGEPDDDVGRAIRSLVAAAGVYMAAFQVRSHALPQLSRCVSATSPRPGREGGPRSRKLR